MLAAVLLAWLSSSLQHTVKKRGGGKRLRCGREVDAARATWLPHDMLPALAEGQVEAATVEL